MSQARPANYSVGWFTLYTAISRKVVRKSARDNPKGIVVGFEITVLHRNFERMAREAMDYVSEC